MVTNHSRLLDFLMKVWGSEEHKVFLALKPTPMKFDIPPGQSWPEKADNIVEWMIGKSDTGIDVYFSPALYNLNSTSKEKKNVVGSQVLWADLDGNAEAALSRIRADRKLPEPSARLQSSLPGHEHWYWFLDRQIDAQRLDDLNKRVTYYLEADKGCWSAEHVLRPPFTNNHKRKEPLPVDFISYEDSTSSPSKFENLPSVKESIVGNVEIEGDLPELGWILASYKWDSKHYDLFINPPNVKGSRDQSMMRLSYFAAEVGMSDKEMYVLLEDMDSRLGKFVGRADRKRQLAALISKARSKYPHTGIISAESDDEVKLVYSVSELLESDFHMDWLIDNFIPKKTINFISAEPGIGKSRLSLQLADAAARGIPFLDKKIEEPMKVMYLSLEMDGPMLKYFIETQQASREPMEGLDFRYLLVPVGNTINILNEEGHRFIDNLLEEYRPDLLFIDTLGSLTLEELGEKEGKSINNAFKRWLAKYEVTLFVIHHNRKPDNSGKKRPTIGDIYGSNYVTTDAAVVFAMHMPDNQGHIELITVKKRFGAQSEDVILDGKQGFDFVIKDTRNEPTTYDDIE